MNTRNKETQIQKKGLGVFINTCIKYLFPNILFLHYVSQISKQRQFSQYKKNMYIYIQYHNTTKASVQSYTIYPGKQNNEERQGKQGRNGETTWKREYGTRFLEIRYAENEGRRSRRC